MKHGIGIILLFFVFICENIEAQNQIRTRQELLSERLYIGRPYHNTAHNNPAIESREYYFRAREYHNRNDYTNALINYETALSMCSWAAYYYHYGLCLMNIDAYEDAEKAFRKTIRYIWADYPYDISEPYCDERGRNMVYSFDNNGIVSELYFSYYNLACIYSITNRLENSFNYIILALEYGYPYLNHIFTDDDLVNLFNSPNSAQIRRDINRIYTSRNVNNVRGKTYGRRPSPNDFVLYEFIDNTRIRMHAVTSDDAGRILYGTYIVTNYHVIISYNRETGARGYGEAYNMGVNTGYSDYEPYDRTINQIEYISLKKMEVDRQDGWGWEETTTIPVR
jgi:tetratricopeptide (TPR) repeat protein